MRNIGLKVISVLVLCLISSPYLFAEPAENNDIDDVFSGISDTGNAVLLIDQQIDDLSVRYYTHVVDGFTIKNDYILLHKDRFGDVVHVEESWSDLDSYDLDLASYSFEKIPYHAKEVFWEKPVVFLEPSDCQMFYTIHSPQEYPLVCLEVRCVNGSTVLFDAEAKKVGIGVPAPTQGFSLTGYCEDYSPDCWIAWRQNADFWYRNWVDMTTSISLPTPQTISSYIEDQSTTLFYELAHGASTYFQAHQPGIYYYASDVEDAMVNREKMRFAFIGSCEGMTNTDEGTFSHAFRKGAITETVTIGYSGMGSCPGWSVSLEWQDTMFYAMDSGYTIREAFDYANGQYPTIADCVVFVGDSDMHIVEIDPDDPEIDIIPPNVLITSPQTNDYVAGTVKVTGKAHDLDGMVKHVYVKIDEDDWVLAEGTDEWEFVLDTSVLSNGLHQIQAISVDDDGFQSGINRIAINVSNSPLTISTTIPSQGLVNQPVQCFAYASGGIPPYRFLWDFGDGTGSNDEDPAHSYNQPGTYQITVTITDQGNTTDTKSSSITIRPNDTTPPSIQIIHPYGGCFVNNQMLFSMDPILIFGPVNITIDAVDDTGPVVAINWYLNDEKILFPTQKSMRWRWDERYFGRFDIDIIAFDAAGNQGEYEMIGYKFF